MSILRALKRLIFGETWLLPVGVAIVVASTALLVRPLAGDSWERLGGFVFLAGVVGVLLVSVARGARTR